MLPLRLTWYPGNFVSGVVSPCKLPPSPLSSSRRGTLGSVAIYIEKKVATAAVAKIYYQEMDLV